MIYIIARLYCDHCNACFIQTRDAHETISRRDLELLRRGAEPMGWRRLKPKGRDKYGDYCGQCAFLIESSRRPRYPSRPI